MEYAIVGVKNHIESQKIIDYLNKFNPMAYGSKDERGLTVVIPCSNPLAYAQEVAGIMGGSIRAYGMKIDGTKFKLKEALTNT